MTYKVGDTVIVGVEKEKLEVYMETTTNGEEYLALRGGVINGQYTICNGALEMYEQGFWGGITG